MAQLVNDASLIYAGDYEQLTGLSSAKRLQAIPTGARVALIQAEDQNVRWKEDGNDPTTSTGMQLAAGKDMWFTGNLANIVFIEEAASAKVNVSYWQ